MPGPFPKSLAGFKLNLSEEMKYLRWDIMGLEAI
jgi:hypothetical protein